MAAGAGDLGDQEVPDLPGQPVQLGPGQLPQVGGFPDLLQHGHLLLLGSVRKLTSAGSNRTPVSGSRPSSEPVSVSSVAISTL